jgi:hypothetical protein
MTKRDYFKTHEVEAFEIAMRMFPDKNTAYWAAEANLTLEEWYHDYRNERV